MMIGICSYFGFKKKVGSEQQIDCLQVSRNGKGSKAKVEDTLGKRESKSHSEQEKRHLEKKVDLLQL